MSTRTRGRLLTTLLLAAATTLGPAGPAGAASVPTEERIDFADATLDGVDRGTGRTVHGVFSVIDLPTEAPFGVTEFFVGDESGIVYECLTDRRTRARIDVPESASAAGALPMECGSPVGLPTRHGYAFVGLRWQGEGEVESLVFHRDPCTEYLDVRHPAVTGRVLLVVPGVAVTTVAPHDHPADELREQRIVCS